MEENNLPNARETKWRELFAAFHSSGLSKTDFCKTNAINQSTFYSWEQRLNPKKRTGSGRGQRFAKVKVISQGSNTDQVRIQFPGGIEIQSSTFPEANWVLSIMKARAGDAP